MHELLRTRGRWIAGVSTGLILGIWCALAWRQVGFWKNTPTLFNHAIESGMESAVVENGLGNYFLEHGETERGLECIQRALELEPRMEAK